MTKLTVEEQLKLVRSEITELKRDVKIWRMAGQSTDDEVKILAVEVRDLSQRFDELDAKLDSWKSQLFDKIDNFLGRIDTQDKEIAALSFRPQEQQAQLDRHEAQRAGN